MTDSTMLETRNLTVKYDAHSSVLALNSVSFSAAASERVALIGANGAGKSTLLSALVGVLPSESGEIYIGGTELVKDNLHILRQKIGMVFQNPDDQLFMPTVFEDVAFGPRNYGLGEQEIKARSEDAAARLGILHLLSRMTHKLSGGEKRLAALAGVLVMEPSVLLLDEPSSFLDPRAARRLADILLDLPQTMLVATHDMDFARRVCSRAIVLKGGNICADAPLSDVLSNAALLDECGL